MGVVGRILGRERDEDALAVSGFPLPPSTGGVTPATTAPAAPVPPLALRRTLPWGDTAGVVSTPQYQPALEEVCGSHSERAFALDVLAVLVPEPTNQEDGEAVRVDIDGRVVGHLSRADALKWRPVIDGAIREHGYAAADATVYGGFTPDGLPGRLSASIRISDLAIERTAGETRLPPGFAVSVSNGERYQEALTAAAGGRQSQGSTSVRAELRLPEDRKRWRKPSVPAMVEVLIDGRTVGFLSPEMTDRYGPTVRQEQSNGRRVTSDATLSSRTRAGRNLVEITLDAMSPDWL